jgi:MFS family permease
MFPLLESGSLWMITIGFCVGQVIISMMYGPYAALLTELFSAEVRYSAASLSYQLGATFGGGLAPLVAAAILVNTGSTFAVSGYMALACLVSWVCLEALGRSHLQEKNCSELGGYNSSGVK